MTSDDQRDDLVAAPQNLAPDLVGADPTVAPAPRPRRSRRVTRTVVLPPAPVDPEPAQTDEPAAVTAVEPADAEPATTGPTTTGGPDVDQPGPVQPELVQPELVQAEPVQAELAQPEPVQAEGADEAAAREGEEPPLDVLAELAGLRAATPPAPARLATTALLFQAPDPAASRPRRRRAQSAAGAPEQISQAAHHDETPAQAAQEDLPQPEAPAPDDAAAGIRSTRRRRGSRAAQAVAELVLDEVVDPEPTDDVDVDEDLDTGSAEVDPARKRRRRRGGRGRRPRADEAAVDGDDEVADGDASDATSADEAGGDEAGGEDAETEGSTRRRRRRRRAGRGADPESRASDEVTALRGSTRLEAKRQRRRDGRESGRRRQVITEAEFLTRRESVDRVMVVRERAARTQIAVLEDGVLVEHYVSNQAQVSMVGNVYLGRVQNVLPSMEAAFVDVGKGRNAVLYAGEVNWDAAGLDGQPRRIEQALKSGDPVLVQVTKDPIGHKGARLTSQVTLAGRYLVLVPGGGMTGISHKLPDTERNRLRKILRQVVPESAGVIVRTAAEGASEQELAADIERLQAQWTAIEAKARTASAPALLQGEPDMAIRVVRDIFNDDFSALVVAGDEAWSTVSGYVADLAPDLSAKVSHWTSDADVFARYRVDEQLAKGMDRKVWLPSGGSLVIDRTEAMTVIDVNTGKFTGSGGTLEETVTRNNLEAAEEIVRQLRLRDIGGMIVVDFIDMVLESNRDLVLRRLVECLGRDRTKHQVAEVTTLGLVQMTRKRVGQGLVEAFSETCEHCHGRGFVVHTDPVEKNGRPDAGAGENPPAEQTGKRASRRKRTEAPAAHVPVPVLPEAREAVKATLATIAAAAAHAHEQHPAGEDAASAVPDQGVEQESGQAPAQV